MSSSSSAGGNGSSSTVDADSNTQIKITLKRADTSQIVEIEPSADVAKLRERVASVWDESADRVTLVFAGRILKDGVTLHSVGLRNEQAVHVVIRNARQQQETQTQSRAQAEQQGDSARNQPRLEPQNPFARFMPNLPGMTPEVMQQLMNSPFVDQLVSNPEILQGFLNTNPQLRSIVDSVPEVRQAFNNPNMIREMLRYARDPNMFQELMRNYDRTVSNVEATPGGLPALERMFRDFEGPMMESLQQNPFAAVSQQQSGNESSAAPPTSMNADPLPNPWGAQAGAAANPLGANMGPNPFSVLMGSGMPFGQANTNTNRASGRNRTRQRRDPTEEDSLTPSDPDRMHTAELFRAHPDEMNQLLTDPRSLEAFQALHEVAPHIFRHNPRGATLQNNADNMLVNAYVINVLGHLRSQGAAQVSSDASRHIRINVGGMDAGGASPLQLVFRGAGLNLGGASTGASARTGPAAAAAAAAAGGTALPQSDNAHSAASNEMASMLGDAFQAGQRSTPATTESNESLPGSGQGIRISLGQNSGGGAQAAGGAQANPLLGLLAQFAQGSNVNESGARNAPSAAATAGTTPASESNAGEAMNIANLLQAAMSGQRPAAPSQEALDSGLETLSSMGFNNRAANLRALTQTFGDVNAAVELLLADPTLGSMQRQASDRQ